jgi:Domain of unknown function (DUF4274)
MSAFRLTQEQKARPNFVFAGHPGLDMVERLTKLETPLELHQFVLHYNVNDSFRPSRAIIRNPLCDRGTALYAYWLFEAIAVSRQQTYHFPESEDWMANWGIGLSLVEEIEERYLADSYKTRLFRFDPTESWTKASLLSLLKKNGGRLPFPVEMLMPTPGEKIEPDWCVT